MVDSAGGRSQLSQLTTSVIVLIVLLYLTKPLQYMPNAVLSSIVFLIGIELVDIAGMRRVLGRRTDEFVIAAITATVVVVVGVEQGILLAIVISILDHLRRSYHPRDVYVVRRGSGGFAGKTVTLSDPPTELEPGLVVYRFGAIMYYANANRFTQEIRAIVKGTESPPAWLCLDAEAITDIDYSAGETIIGIHAMTEERGSRLVFAAVEAPVKQQLDRYGITELIGEDAFFPTVEDVVEAFRARAGAARGLAARRGRAGRGGPSAGGAWEHRGP